MFIIDFKKSKCLHYGINIHLLKPDILVLVVTKNNLYKLTKGHEDKYDVSIQGGKLFPEAKKIKFTGSTFGGSMLKIGWIGKGMLMEMYCVEDDKVYKTSGVMAARIIGDGWEYDMEWDDAIE